MSLFHLFKKKVKREPRLQYKDVIIVGSFLDIPENTGENVYLVRSGKFNKWVIFTCPNRCGERIEVNLMKVRSPKWKLLLKRKKISICPSIVHPNCGAHFWLEQSEVIWARFDSNIDF